MEKEIESALEDKSLTEANESALLEVFTQFGIGQEDLDENGAYTRLVQAGILWDLMEGEARQRIRLEMPDLTFRMQKSETLLWVYPNVDYYTVRARRELEGRFYFLSGRFTAYPVQDEETVHVDSGVFGITTRHVYFAGASERFRIGHDRIVTVEPYSGPAGMIEGVSIMRDSAGARLETFFLGDGSFAYKLFSRTASPDRSRALPLSERALSAPGAADEREHVVVRAAGDGRPSGSDDDAWLPGHGQNHPG